MECCKLLICKEILNVVGEQLGEHMVSSGPEVLTCSPPLGEQMVSGWLFCDAKGAGKAGGFCLVLRRSLLVATNLFQRLCKDCITLSLS